MVQQTAAALGPFLPDLVEHLRHRLEPRGVLWLVDSSTAKLEGLEPKREWIAGEPPSHPIEIMENGLRLEVDLETSQKTGYYLDQRDNRHSAARWIPPAARVLMFAVTLAASL